MAIAVTAPLGTPVVTLTPTGGGSLAAATYEIGVACANTSSYTLLTADQLRSAAWIGQVVVALNEKITVSYPAVTNATHYNIYIRNVTTGETWYGGSRRHGSSATAATTALTSYEITSLGTRQPHFDNFTYDTTYFTPPVALNQGTIVVHISGTDTAAYYYQNIYDALNTAGLTSHIAEQDGEFWLNGQLIIDSGATGAIAFYNWKQTTEQAQGWGIHFMQGIVLNNSSSFTVTWGTMARAAILYLEAWSWNLNTQYMDCTNLVIQGANYQKLKAQTYIWGGDHYIIINDNTVSTEGLSLKGVATQNQKTNGAVTGIVSNAALLGSLENTTFQYCQADGYGNLTNRTGAETVKDSTILNNTFSRHYRPRNSISGGVYFYNNRWKNTSTTLPTSPLGTFLDRPEVYWESAATGLANIIYQGATFQIKVVDGAGTAVSGATVTLYRESDDSQILSQVTDADGKSTATDVVYESGAYDGSGVYGNGSGVDYSWLHTTWTTRSFRLEITAPNYATHVTRGITFKTPYYATVNIGNSDQTSMVIMHEITEGVYHG